MSEGLQLDCGVLAGMLKYGRGAVHSEAQPLEDACRDLHCRRDRYTWTSHPALDGTSCGRNKVNRGTEVSPEEVST